MGYKIAKCLLQKNYLDLLLKYSNNSCEMDMKEELPLSDNVVSQNETDFFTMKRNSDVAIKTEIKSESPVTEHFIKEITPETATCSNWEIDMKTEIEEQTVISHFGSLNEGEFLLENPVMKLGKFNSEYELDNKTEVKVEPLWLEPETSSVCGDSKDGHLPPRTSSRFCMELSGAGSDKSPLSLVEVSGRETNRYNLKDHLEHECQKNDVTEMPTVEEHFLSECSVKCSEGGEASISPLYLKQKDMIPMGKRPHQCNICDKSFSQFGDLKRHNLIHEGKKPHHCKNCGKSFTLLSHLKNHNLIHEGKKAHQCKTCDKSFTLLGDLRRHNLIHEGRKPHHCKICDKSFTQPGDLKRHNLIHEGKKPHQCKNCGKSFTLLSHLKTHHLIYEGKKPHHCKTCGKSFTLLSHLKRHNIVHEGKKPHQCKTCEKSFAQLSSLKRHNLIHKGKKPHQCKTCEKSFTRLGDLKRHNMIHEGKKPHHCKTCDKSFTRLGDLRRHNLIHEGKKLYQCKTCDKSFTQLSHLKRHYLVHNGKK